MEPAHAEWLKAVQHANQLRAEQDEYGHQRLLANYTAQPWQPVNVTGTAPVTNYSAATLTTTSRG